MSAEAVGLTTLSETCLQDLLSWRKGFQRVRNSYLKLIVCIKLNDPQAHRSDDDKKGIGFQLLWKLTIHSDTLLERPNSSDVSNRFKRLTPRTSSKICFD